MKEEACREFRKDPEQYPEHLESCAACREELEELARITAPAEIETSMSLAASLGGRLPVAPWEGAAYRPWPLLLGSALLLTLVAALTFVAAGVSPISGMKGIWVTLLPRINPVKLFSAIGNLVQGASPAVQISIGVSFVVVNFVFAFMLRRAPKGYDVAGR